ncbi:MAG: hypothetical protein LBL67_00510 [Coriobacteriales bacterium]|jgi:hypothetical protein|nr:hypothetical protein [Coriobacteriales bacterium]
MQIKTKALQIVAGIIWIIAGLNVCAIGIETGINQWVWWECVASFVIFVLFLLMFLKITAENARRIERLSAEEPTKNVFRMMDVRAYAVMIFMIALGLVLRIFSLVPIWFIAFFYTGLGAALGVAGVAYLVVFVTDSLPRS